MHFSDSHEWVIVKNSVAIVGVSEYAQKELGDIVYIELPEIGKQVSKGQEIAVLESTKAAADIYSPISGEIMEVNEKLKDAPHLINQSPEDEGWIVKMKPSIPEEVKKLMSEEEYKKSLR